MDFTKLFAVGNPLAEIFILTVCTLPAWLMASQNSSWLITYLIATWAFGPEVRRINDWAGGAYESVTLLSLIPTVATLSLAIPIFRSTSRLTPRLKRGLGMIYLALTYGTLLGIITSGVAGLFEGTGLLLPLLFVPYAAGRPYIESERNRWLRSLVAIAALVAAYGWYQFVTAPPWDMYWMMASGMYTSQGKPIPMEFRVFSTLNSAGPLAVFMAASLVIGLCQRKWQGPGSIPGLLLVASCLLISQIRSGWVMVAIAVGSYVALAKGKNRWVAVLVVIMIAGVVNFALPMLPGAEMVSNRMDTLGHLEDDNSSQGRIQILAGGLGSAMANPFGGGFGSSGVGAKLTVKNGGSGGVDNGYLDLCATLGIPMTALLLLGISTIGMEAWRSTTSHQQTQTTRSPHNLLAIAMLFAYAGALMIYNNLTGVCGALLWLTVACPLGDKSVSELKPALRRNRPGRFARMVGSGTIGQQPTGFPPFNSGAR